MEGSRLAIRYKSNRRREYYTVDEHTRDFSHRFRRWYDGYFVTNNGNKYYGSRGVRVYNFHYISGGAPSWFAVHDSYANDLFLGSWYDMERYVLCKKTATVNEEVGSSESTTFLAIERAGMHWEEGEGE